MGKIEVSHFLVYMLTCLVDGAQKAYIGMTGVLVGQSDDAALLVRRRFHISCQKTWLKGMNVSTLQLRKLFFNLSEAVRYCYLLCCFKCFKKSARVGLLSFLLFRMLEKARKYETSAILDISNS